MHDKLAQALIEEVRETRREQTELLRRILQVTERIYRALPSSVIGGTFTQIGDPDTMADLVPIQPGQSPKFQVTPAFSGAPFTLDGTKAAIATSDPTNAPAALDLTDDPAGTTFVINLTANVNIGPGGEVITVTWTYVNADGTTATVTGTITENGIVDDVTGGTFSQVA